MAKMIGVKRPLYKEAFNSLLGDTRYKKGVAVKNYLMRLLSNLRPGFAIDNTILLFAHARGGSTWLAEVLATVPRSTWFVEPSLLNALTEEYRCIWDLRNIEIAYQRDDLMMIFFNALLRGRIKYADITPMNGSLNYMLAKHLVIKFCHAHLLLPWICKNYNTRRPILLLRHPCAILNSRLKFRKKNFFSNAVRDKAFYEKFLRRHCLSYYQTIDVEEFRRVISSIDSLEEFAIANWCLDTAFLISQPTPHRWHLLYYEDLVQKPLQELQKVFGALSLELPQSALKAVNKPSSTTHVDSSLVKGKKFQHVWMKELNSRQINQALRVMRAFKVDIYDDSLYPTIAGRKFLTVSRKSG